MKSTGNTVAVAIKDTLFCVFEVSCATHSLCLVFERKRVVPLSTECAKSLCHVSGLERLLPGVYLRRRTSRTASYFVTNIAHSYQISGGF